MSEELRRGIPKPIPIKSDHTFTEEELEEYDRKFEQFIKEREAAIEEERRKRRIKGIE